MAQSIVLRIRRTLDGAEIDKVIWDVEAHKALAAEHRRRADWRERDLAASRFRAECDHLDVARLPTSCSRSGAVISDVFLIGRRGGRTRPEDLEWPRRVYRRAIVVVGVSVSRRLP